VNGSTRQTRIRLEFRCLLCITRAQDQPKRSDDYHCQNRVETWFVDEGGEDGGVATTETAFRGDATVQYTIVYYYQVTLLDLFTLLNAMSNSVSVVVLRRSAEFHDSAAKQVRVRKPTQQQSIISARNALQNSGVKIDMHEHHPAQYPLQDIMNVQAPHSQGEMNEYSMTASKKLILDSNWIPSMNHNLERACLSDLKKPKGIHQRQVHL
jgi:hypothetical protein